MDNHSPNPHSDYHIRAALSSPWPIPDQPVRLMTENKFNLTELVRSLQRGEGHEDCFRRGAASCDRMECSWRTLCLDEPKRVPGGDKSI